MKITVVLGAFFPVPPTMGGAVEKAWFALAQEFARRGHDVTLVSRWLPELQKIEQVDGVKYLRVPGFDTPRSLLWLKFLDLIYSWRVRRILPAADIIVTNTFWLPWLLRDEKRGKIYVHVARFPKGQLRFYAHAGRLQTLSHAIGRAMTREAPQLAEKIVVIPNPRPQAISPEPPPPLAARDKTILFVGRLHPEKGVHLLLQAFVENRAALADWRLVLVGPSENRHGGGGQDYLEELQRLARNAGDQIQFRGAIFDEAILERELRGAQLFVYPSLAERGETFGLAPLEAMANGCAVLVSRLECFEDFVLENETGFFFDHRAANPAQALGRRMVELIADEDLLARVAGAGYRRSEQFSLGTIAARFLQDFESVKRET